MKSVLVTRDEGVVRLTLNHPDRANALGAPLVEALLEAVSAAIDSGARVLVLAGEGRSFCGGFDLSGLDEETDASLAYRFLRIELLLQMIQYAPCYTVALAHGPVSGAGADLVASCARRIAAADTTLRFPGVRFGVALGSARLVELVGLRARALLLEQQTLRAAEALSINLVDTLAEPPEWDALVSGIARRVTSVPEEATRRVMELNRSVGDRDLGVLARSVAEPGLKARMQAYWDAVRAAASRAAARREGQTAD